MRNTLEAPVPKVYAWNSRANDSTVGAEFIIMEKIPGVPLRNVWQSMEPADKLKIYLQVFGWQKAWSLVRFTRFGSLYYTQNLIDTLQALFISMQREDQLKTLDLPSGQLQAGNGLMMVAKN